MSVLSNYSAAVGAAQAVMTMWVPGLVVDRKWGGFTQSAYESLTSDQRSMADTALRAFGYSASQARAVRIAEKAEASTMTVGNIDEAIAKAAAKTGVPVQHLRGFVKIESNFNPTAVNGSSRGLAQMQPGAWSDARKVNPEIGPYSNVFDPYLNALAGATYYRINQRGIARIPGFVGNITPAMVYLAHQQGLGGFAELWNASQGRKTTNYVTSKAMSGNPPQDGKGITTDKAEFYRRWLAVAERKIG